MKTLFVLISLMSTATWAQTSEETDSVVLQPIQVKGFKEQKSQLESTESVTVLRDEGLAGTGTDDALLYLNGTGNVQVNKNGESFTIRGINNVGVTGFQKDNLSSILIDDIFQTELSIAAGAFDAWDMDSVEIHRGAQSTTQGVNSLAGTIFLYHEAPKNLTEGTTRIGYGSYNTRDLGLMFNRPLIERRLLTRVSYHKDQTDGHITNTITGNKKWNHRDQDNVSLSTQTHLNETDLVQVHAKYLRLQRGGLYVQGENPFAFEVSEDIDYNQTTESRQFGVSYNKALSPQVSNKLSLTFTSSAQDVSSDADGTSQDLAGTRIETHDDRYFSAENLVRFQGEKTRHLLGVHFHDFDLDETFDLNILYPVGAATTPIAVDQTYDRGRQTFAIFNTLIYDWDERNSFTLGLRWETVKSRYSTDVTATRLQNLGGTTNAAIDSYLSAVSGSYGDQTSNSVWLPKIAWTHNLGAHQLGLSYTEGYRTGGLSINRRRATAVTYEPEQTSNYEFSYRYEAMKNLQFNANAFFIEWRDQQVQVSLSNDFYDTQVVNAASSQLSGGEIEARYQLPKDRISLSAGYVDTKFVNFTNNGIDYSGRRFPFASNWTSRLSYTRLFSDAFSASSILRYLGPSYSNAENNRHSSEQFLFDASALYQWGEFAFETYVKNLFDRQFLIFDGRPREGATYQATYNLTNTPREIGARLSYYW